jgi:hypothetical protein
LQPISPLPVLIDHDFQKFVCTAVGSIDLLPCLGWVSSLQLRSAPPDAIDYLTSKVFRAARTV